MEQQRGHPDELEHLTAVNTHSGLCFFNYVPQRRISHLSSWLHSQMDNISDQATLLMSGPRICALLYVHLASSLYNIRVGPDHI